MLFSLLMQAAGGWALTRYFVGLSEEAQSQLFYFRLAMLFGLLSAVVLLALSVLSARRGRLILLAAILLASLIGGLLFTDMGVGKINVQPGGDAAITESGIGYVLYVGFFGVSYALSLLAIYYYRVRSSLSNDLRFVMGIAGITGVSLTVYAMIPDLVGQELYPVNTAVTEAIVVLVGISVFGQRLARNKVSFLRRSIRPGGLLVAAATGFFVTALLMVAYTLTAGVPGGHLIATGVIGSVFGLELFMKHRNYRVLNLPDKGFSRSKAWEGLGDLRSPGDIDSLIVSAQQHLRMKMGYGRATITYRAGARKSKNKDADMSERVMNGYLDFRLGLRTGYIGLTEAERREVKQLMLDICAVLSIYEMYHIDTESLKSQNESKDEFISLASHQLRTPISIASLNNKMMLDGAFGEFSDEQKAAISESQQGIERMEGIVNELLEVARVDEGSFTISKSRTSVAELARKAVSHHKPAATEKGVKLSCKIANSGAHTEVDELKIFEVMSNLIDNAVKYTDKGGRVTVTVDDEDGAVRLTVKDTGKGIPQGEQSVLFTKFGRTPSARKSRPDGLGLGLYLAEKTVEAHDGEIIFESKEGTGSTFGFWIPAA